MTFHLVVRYLEARAEGRATDHIVRIAVDRPPWSPLTGLKPISRGKQYLQQPGNCSMDWGYPVGENADDCDAKRHRCDVAVAIKFRGSFFKNKPTLPVTMSKQNAFFQVCKRFFSNCEIL